MLHAESEWVLTCLEVDIGDIAFLDSENCDPATSTTVDNDSFSQRDIPQPLPPPSSKRGLACSEDLSIIFTTYGSYLEKRLATVTSTTPARDLILKGQMKQANATARRLQAIGMPDMDICVLLALLTEETMHNTDRDRDLSDADRDSDMINTASEYVIVAVKMWRLVSYCKLLAMMYCSHDKLVVADLSKIDTNQNSLNVFEFDSIEDVLTKHDLKCTHWKMDHDTGELFIQQMSPFDAVGKFIRRLTCIAEVPFSYIQGMSFLSTNGGFMCDPWVLEPSLSTDSPSFHRALALQVTEYIKLFFLQGYLRRAQSKDLVKNVVPSHVLSPSFIPGTLDRIHVLSKGQNLNHILVPIEILRDYCDRSVMTKKGKQIAEMNQKKTCPSHTPIAKDKQTLKAKAKRNNRVTMSTTDAIHQDHQPTEIEYTHAQITLRFWTAYRQEGVAQTSFFENAMEERLRQAQGDKKANSHSGRNEGCTTAAGGVGGRRTTTNRRGKWDGKTFQHYKADNDDQDQGSSNISKDTDAESTISTVPQSSTEEAREILVQKLKDSSVLDLLSLDKSFQGFNDILNAAVSDDKIGVPSTFSDTIGVLMNPIKTHDLRGTVQVALEYEPKLHHPVQNKVCVWAFAHHRPYTIHELEKLINKQDIPFHVDSDKMPREGALSQHYPTHYELRRRIEMSVLLQYSVCIPALSICVSVCLLACLSVSHQLYLFDLWY